MADITLLKIVYVASIQLTQSFLSFFASGLSSVGRTISWIGILGFCLAAVFALVSLPVEFNASRRGLKLLGDSRLVGAGQMPYARNVLTAAALTYVAALAQSLAQLMYLVYVLGGSRRRR